MLFSLQQEEKDSESGEVNPAFMLELDARIKDAVKLIDTESGINRKKSNRASSSVKAVEQALRDILKEMKQDSDRKKADLVQQGITEQWKHVAAMYDRVAMALFIFIVLGITIWFVTLTPKNDGDPITVEE